MNRICIIYKIKNIITNEEYIGSSVDIKERIRRHFKDLKYKKHHSSNMQKSYNKYGKNAFKVFYLAKCPEYYRVKMEQWFIDNNICYYDTERTVGKPGLGRIISQKEREDSRNRMLGNEYWKLTPKMSEENRKKAKERAKNRIWTDESRKKLSNSLKKLPKRERKPHSDYTKKLMSENSRNKTCVFQYDLNGNFLKEWDSISQVVKELGFYQASISRCCQGKQKTASNFLWKKHKL